MAFHAKRLFRGTLLLLLGHGFDVAIEDGRASLPKRRV
jgi:hypothetical protein